MNDDNNNNNNNNIKTQLVDQHHWAARRRQEWNRHVYRMAQDRMATFVRDSTQKEEDPG